MSGSYLPEGFEVGCTAVIKASESILRHSQTGGPFCAGKVPSQVASCRIFWRFLPTPGPIFFDAKGMSCTARRALIRAEIFIHMRS